MRKSNTKRVCLASIEAGVWLWLTCIGTVALVGGYAPPVQAQDGFGTEFDSAGISAGAEASGQASGAADSGGMAAQSAASAQPPETGQASASPGAAEASAETAAGASPPPQDEETSLKAERFRRHNTLHGPVGGLRVLDADSAAVGSFRLQLAASGFGTSDWLVEGDDNDWIGATLSFSWTPLRFLEAYASLHSHANSNTAEDPALFQVLGDTVLGAKAWFPVLPWLSLGGDVRLVFLNSVGDIGVVFGGTSVGLRGNASADFRRLDNPIPLIARFNMDYFFDNSSELVEDVERARYDALPEPRPEPTFESQHLLSRVERFALGINRVDMLSFGLGLEAPFEVDDDFFLQPLVEWQIGVPINRQGYVCLYLPDEPGEDSCLDQEGIGAIPSTLSFGVRVLPPLKGLALLAAADIGLTGTSTFVRELAPTAPYRIIAALSYAYDPTPPPPVVQRVEVVREVEKPEPPTARIRGQVVEKGPGTPVAGASVDYVGLELTPQRTTADGRFVSYALQPGELERGEVMLRIQHPDYEPADCGVTLPPEGGDVQLSCPIVALPRVGEVAGQVSSASGSPVSGASVQISGPASRTLTTDASGRFQGEELPPGQYAARVEADGFLIKLQDFTVVAKGTARPEVTLVPKPERSLVKVASREIRIRRQIHFVTDSAEIEARSTPLLSEIADVLLRNPQIRLVEIQGHTDNRGGRQHNLELSQARADSVRDWLVEAGVESSRLEAKGYGPDRPLVPNITPANRARNRRVQFIIQEQGE